MGIIGIWIRYYKPGTMRDDIRWNRAQLFKNFVSRREKLLKTWYIVNEIQLLTTAAGGSWKSRSYLWRNVRGHRHFIIPFIRFIP